MGWRSLWISGNQNVLFLKEVEVFYMHSFLVDTIPQFQLSSTAVFVFIMKLGLERSFLLALQDFSWHLLVYLFNLGRFCSVINLHCKTSTYHLIQMRVCEEILSFSTREIHSGKVWKHGSTKYLPWLWPQGRCLSKVHQWPWKRSAVHNT